MGENSSPQGPRASRFRAALTGVLAVALGVVAGCGGGASGKPSSGAAASVPTGASAPYLLSVADVRRIGAASGNPGPVTAVIGFWRAVQYQNYPAGYLLLDPPLRARIAYARFQSVVSNARGVFLSRPRILDVTKSGALVTVDVALGGGGANHTSDQVIGFNVRKAGRGWVIATDPYNMFRVAP
jgi:hypothetical protein